MPTLGGRRPFAERVASDQDLGGDLGRAEIAHQRHRARMAEAAAQGAADLGRDAERAPVFLGDEDRFDLLPIGKAEQPFARAVSRLLHRAHRRPSDGIALGKALAQPLGQRRHRREIIGALVVDPMEELPCPKRRLSRRHGLQPGYRRFERRHVEADQARLAVGRERLGCWRQAAVGCRRHSGGGGHPACGGVSQGRHHALLRRPR